MATLFGLPTRSILADSAIGWGSNGNGELGDGTTTLRNSPVAISGLSSGVRALATNWGHSLAVQNGAAYAWGFNGYGELGDGTTTNHRIPAPVNGLASGVTAIAAGGADSTQAGHSLAVQNGAVYAWGNNFYGQLGDGTTIGRLAPVPVVGLTNGATAVAAGENHSLAVINGGVFAWGFNRLGQLGDGGGEPMSTTSVAVSGLSSGVTKIAAGWGHSLAVQNGGVYAWGENFYGQLGDGTGFDRSTPVAVSGLTSGVTSIAAGYLYSLAVQNGHVYAWGNNEQGQLGDGTITTHQLAPELIDPADLNNIIAVAASFNSSYALSSDGSLWVWGDNNYSELGLGTTDNQLHPTPQHLLPPAGFVFTSINSGIGSVTALATLVAVSEPSSCLLLALGSLSGAVMLWRRRYSTTIRCSTQ